MKQSINNQSEFNYKVIDNIESAFSINQKVNITDGIYKNHYGKIIHYEKQKEIYHVEITIEENKKQIIGCKIASIRAIKKFPWTR